MATSKTIKGKIRATRRTHQVTRAMEAVSAVKMRKSQQAALRARPYAVHAVSLLLELLKKTVLQDPLLVQHENGKTLYIVITGDRGLSGSYNARVIRAVERHIHEGGYAKEATDIIACGKKGEEYFSRRGYAVTRIPIGETFDRNEVELLVTGVTRSYLSGMYKNVYIAYTNFRSAFIQEATIRNILPLSVSELTNVLNGITPERGKWSDATAPTPSSKLYTIEPSPEEVLHALIPKLLSMVMYHAFLESSASEHSSRMVAMKNAREKSKDMERRLTLVFNKLRQAGITREVSEIISGREALGTS